jgi:hypothetical protein
MQSIKQLTGNLSVYGLTTCLYICLYVQFEALHTVDRLRDSDRTPSERFPSWPAHSRRAMNDFSERLSDNKLVRSLALVAPTLTPQPVH